MANGNQNQNPIQPGPSTFTQAGAEGFGRLGGALIGSALTEATQDPNVGAAAQQAINQTVNMISQRFWQHEAENFAKTYGNEYSKHVTDLWSNYQEIQNSLNGGKHPDTGQEVDPWGEESIAARNEAMQSLIQGLSQADIRFMQNASKYGNNPVIGNMANALLASRAQTFRDMTGAYGEQVAQGQGVAELQAAQFQASPEMQSITKRSKKAEAGLKEAQAGYYRRMPAVGAQQREQFGFVPKNVPIGRAPAWLSGTPEGRERLEPYLREVQGEIMQQLSQKYSKEELAQPGFVEDKLVGMGRQIREDATRRYILNTATAEERAALRAAGHGDLLAPPEAPQMVEPQITGKLTEAGRKRQIEGTTEDTGWGPMAMDELENLVRTRDFDSVEDAVATLEAEWIKPMINNTVGTFSGSEKEKRELRSRLRDYLLKNAKKDPTIKELISGKPQKEGFLKRTKKGMRGIKAEGARTPIPMLGITGKLGRKIGERGLELAEEYMK